MSFIKIGMPETMIFLFGFMAFLQVTFIPSYVYYVTFFSLAVSGFLFSIIYNIKIDKKIVLYFFIYLSCFLVGVLSYPFSMVVEKRLDYSGLEFSGRITNLILLFWVFVFIYSYHMKKGKDINDFFLIIRSYQLGLFVVVLAGAWQLLSFYSSIPFPFETRSYLHSTYGANYSFSQRLTSIAREPSFFVMIVIDFIGLSILFYRGLRRISMIMLGLVMVVFSLSPSGYLTLAGTVVAAVFFSEIKYFSLNIKFVRIAGILIFATVLCVFFMLNEQVFEYIYSRIFYATPDNSIRFYMIVMPYMWSIDGNLFSVLFGHGIKSYSIIGTYYNLPSGVPVHPTSNNIYTDIFWESGLIGIILLIFFYTFIFIRIFKSKIGRFFSFIAFYFFFDIVFSGVFRADYASARFFIILYLIYLITENQLIGRCYSENSRNHT